MESICSRCSRIQPLLKYASFVSKTSYDKLWPAACTKLRNQRNYIVNDNWLNSTRMASQLNYGGQLVITRNICSFSFFKIIS